MAIDLIQWSSYTTRPGDLGEAKLMHRQTNPLAGDNTEFSRAKSVVRVWQSSQALDYRAPAGFSGDSRITDNLGELLQDVQPVP
jgi:hypothetical protein